MRWIILIFRLFVGFLFIYASIYKIVDPGQFAASIRNYGLVPPVSSNLIAMTLPWLELVAGIFLVIGIQTRASALLTTVMMAVFLGALIYAYSTGLDIDCGCFSSSTQSSGHISLSYIFRDAGITLLSVCILVFDSRDFSATSFFEYGVNRHEC